MVALQDGGESSCLVARVPNSHIELYVNFLTLRLSIRNAFASALQGSPVPGVCVCVCVCVCVFICVYS